MIIKDVVDGISWISGTDDEIKNFSFVLCEKCKGKIELIKKEKKYSECRSGNLIYTGDSYRYKCSECGQIYIGSVTWEYVD